MPVHNADVAALFNEMADLLAIQEANPFRVRAYREAASTIERLPRQLSDMLAAGEDLTALEGIGKDLAGKIREIVETRSLGLLREVEQQTAPALIDLLKIPGLGPKRVRVLHDRLGIVTKADLRRAAEQQQIREIKGFGARLEARILDALKAPVEEQRTLLPVAEEVASSLVEYLRTSTAVDQVEVAGSYRRRKETVGDLDVLVTSATPKAAIDHFARYEDIREVVSKGTTRSTVILTGGLQVDLRVVKTESYGAALFYFTGSKAHNIHLRDWALKRGLKINEYGVFKGKKRIAGKTEAEIYDLFGLPYIEPELRENRGELEAARQGMLPRLVTVADIRGDLHAHTTGSDGHDSLEDMARAAKAQGYSYLAITDHSPALAVTKGLDARALAIQIDAIDRLNERLKGFQVLKSIEVDILEDGSLDLPDDILKELDLRVCSVHSKFNLSEDKQTERILRAMDHPCFNILAHPTGRLLGKRKPYAVDVERLMQAALERGCFLEVNAQPQRLDLKDDYIKLAKEMGLKLAISTDAHRTTELTWMRYGVDQARRGWLEAGDVLNTRSWRDLKKLLRRT